MSFNDAASDDILVPDIGGTEIREANYNATHTATSHNPYKSTPNHSSADIISRDRLPTLFEVLNKKTDAPLDLWSFYVFMRDDQHAIDYLDFWIDVVSHLALCKEYVTELRSSVHLTEQQRRFANNNNNNTINNHQSTSSSMLLDALVQDESMNNNNSTFVDDSKRLSAFLRGDDEYGPFITNSGVTNATGGSAANPEDARFNELLEKLQYRQKSTAQRSTGATGSNIANDTSNGDYMNSGGTSVTPNANLFSAAEVELLASEKAQYQKVKRSDLQTSARRILLFYFLDNSEKKIQLPQQLVNEIRTAIEDHNRDDPEIFDAARDYVFQAMENEAFPVFLSKRALHNISDFSYLVRLILGFFFFFVAFWVGYTLIFLGYKPAHDRGVVTLPFFFASYCIFSSFFKLDPLLAFCGYGENIARSKGNGWLIKIDDQYVRGLLKKRAMWVTLLICVVSAAFSVIFGLVPGHRL